jgi:hypothetical protein
LQDPPKFTQIRIFGLKIYHLATLVSVKHFGMIGKSKEGLALQSLCFQRQVAKEAELKDF